MAKQQTRVVLRDCDRPLVDQIIEATGVTSPSEALSLLLRRYSSHFINWFTSDPHQCQLGQAPQPQGQIGFNPIVPPAPAINQSDIEDLFPL